MEKAYKQYIGVAVILALVLSATSCAQPQNTNTIYIEDLVEASKNQEEDKLEQIKISKSDDIKKHYAGDLYFQDFSEIKNKLDSEYEIILEEQLSEVVDVPYFVKADVEYYNSSLELAQENGWGINEILNEPGEHIRSLKFRLNYFIDDDFNTNHISLFFENMVTEFRETGLVNINVGSVIISSEVLSDQTIEEFKLNNTSMKSLLGSIKFIDEYGDDFYSFTSNRLIDNHLKELNQKYNNDFTYATGLTKDTNGDDVYALKENTDIKFELNESVGDKFLTALAQKYMQDLITEFIKDENAEDFIIPLVIPNEIKDSRTDKNSYDTGSIKTREDIIRFLNEGFLGEYDSSLIYLKEPGEEIDFEIVKRLSSKIRGIIENVDTLTSIDIPRNTLYVTYYDIDKEKVSIVKDLFIKDYICSAYYKSDVNMGNLYARTSQTREEIDAFHYLDHYSQVNSEFITLVAFDPEEIDNMTTEEFIERTSYDSKY